MNCHEFWNEMPELADSGGLPAHAQECPSCVILLQRQRALAAGLSYMAQNAKSAEAPGRVEQRLVRAFRIQAGRQPKPAGRYWAAGTAAAVVLVAVSWIVSRPVKSTGPDVPLQAMAELADPESNLAFMPLPYGSADSSAAVQDEDADLVHVEVPRTALVALGLPVALNGSARVEAEVALGADGMLEGIRIVQ